MKKQNDDDVGFEGRVARIEGAHPHMATKEDLKDLKGDLIERISAIESSIKTWRTATIVVCAFVVAVAALVKWL